MLHQKGRARVACKLCHLRRVKCDRTLDRPCSNCRSAGSVCELINSRRGKYPRASNRRAEASPSATNESYLPPVAASGTPPVQNISETRLEPIESPESDRTSGSRRYVSPSLTEIAVQHNGGDSSGNVVYMGDSANFKYVLHEVGDPFQTSQRHRFWGDNLQRSMLDRLGHSTQSTMKLLAEEDDAYLRSSGSFNIPAKNISDALIDAFARYSYPVFPIFDWKQFYDKYNSDQISPLLLNAIYMVATFHCPEITLREAGFPSRYIAGLVFYRRAKSLYDSDYETGGVTIVQATLLMSTWWASPTQQKDTWHWLGVAANLAQSLGMHRCKSYSILSDSTRKVWRRIWWVLYVNDIHHAAVFGRPPHIQHSRFSDLALLHESDFEDDAAPSGGLRYRMPSESRSAFVHLVKLATRVGGCLVNKLSSDEGTEETDRESYNGLISWEQGLPDEIRNIPSTIAADRGFWPSMIRLLYYDYQIVFYRMLSPDPITIGLDSPLFQAAGKISRLLEDLLASGTLYDAPFIILPSIFASSLICIMNIRKGESNIRAVSEHRVRLAMQVLDEFQNIWPIAIWTRHLLDCLLKIPSGQAQLLPISERLDTDMPSSSREDPQLCHTDYNHDAFANVPDLGPIAGPSPPQSMSNSNVFSYDDLDSSLLSGHSVSFPFTNLFEDVGLSLGLYNGGES